MDTRGTPLGDIVNWTQLAMPPGRRLQRPRFDAADTIQVLIRDNTPITQHGFGVGVGTYTPIPRRDPGSCTHLDTICSRCRRQWDQDYFLAVFDHGTPGAYKNQGCRCDPCRTAINNR